MRLGPTFTIAAGIALAIASTLTLTLVACGSASSTGAETEPSLDSDGGRAPGDPALPDGAAGPDATSPVTCIVTATAAASAQLARATVAGEHTLVFDAASTSTTSWAEKGNEAVVLEVLRGEKRLAHVVLHQGRDRFSYGIHTGALAAGEELSVRVSPLTAPSAQPSACISSITLAPASALGDAAEGVAHAPVFAWPKQKAFDDLPVLVGWSRGGKSYQLGYTNENGGTVAICGGGAKGIRSEIARWGRSVDIEGGFSYGGAAPSFGRCSGTAAPRMEGDHPVLYYGDGHNRLYESRGGYGQACGTSGDNRSDGNLEGWNTNNPGNEPEKDDPFTIVLRPLPFDLDTLGFRQYGGRREALVDTYAPWLYRVASDELAREGKIDGAQSFAMNRYLFVDVYAADVGGSGDATCGLFGVSGGFVVRAVTAGGVVSNGPQMTADYFGAQSPGVKRLAIPLAAGVTPKDITKLVFDAYDNDGIYLLGIGDAFVPQPSGTNGATLEYVNKGVKKIDVYVDDGNSGCANGTNTRDGVAYPCVGTLHDVNL